MHGEIGELRDQLSIDTPELVSLQFPLAGVGSRGLALLLDLLIQAVAVMILVILSVILVPSLGRFSSTASKWVIAAFIFVPFSLYWGYFTLFEAFGHGQTPGKSITGIRVIQQTGRPIGLFESMVRNLIRVIDWLPGFYGVGVVSIFVTRRQQRLGDLAAGTLVIHERGVDPPLRSSGGSRTFTAGAFESMVDPAVVAQQSIRPSGIPADLLARLALTDLQVLESFLARRLDLPLDSRAQLANKLVVGMTTKMQYAKPGDVSDETFLEGVAHDRRAMPG
jgi:uncharacterized RDD family membrane protein YckC